MQAVHQLALVLVDPFHLHVENGIHVDVDPILLLQQVGQSNFILLSGQHETLFVRTPRKYAFLSCGHLDLSQRSPDTRMMQENFHPTRLQFINIKRSQEPSLKCQSSPRPSTQALGERGLGRGTRRRLTFQAIKNATLSLITY